MNFFIIFWILPGMITLLFKIAWIFDDEFVTMYRYSLIDV